MGVIVALAVGLVIGFIVGWLVRDARERPLIGAQEKFGLGVPSEIGNAGD